MYTANEVSRPEISAFLEQAQGQDKYFVGRKLAPIHTVNAQAGRYPRLNVKGGNLLKRDVTKRNSAGSYNEISRKHTWDTYDCEDRGLEERIDDTKKMEMKNFFDLETLTAKLVQRQMNIDFEVNVAKTIMDPATFAEHDGGTAYSTANLETVDIPLDIDAAMEALVLRGEEVNTMTMSLSLWNYVKHSTKLQQYLYGKLGPDVQKRLITPKDVGAAWGIDNVIIAAASYDSANRAKDPKLDPIWGDKHIFLGCVKAGDFSAGGVARTLVWDADTPSGLFATETYRNSNRRSDMVRVRSNSIEKVVNEAAGQLIKTGR